MRSIAVGRTARFRQACSDARQQGLAVQLRLLPARADEALGALARELGDHRAGRRHVDRDRLRRAIVDGGVVRLVVLATIRNPLRAPQLLDQVDGFAKPRRALLRLRPRHAGGRRLVERFPGAHTQDHPAGKHHAKRAERLGHDRRVIAERRRQHARPHDDARGPRPQRAEPRQRERSVAAGVPPRLEMIADEHRLEADLLREAGKLEQLARSELLRRGFVAQSQHRFTPRRRRAALRRERSTFVATVSSSCGAHHARACLSAPAG